MDAQCDSRCTKYFFYEYNSITKLSLKLIYCLVRFTVLVLFSAHYKFNSQFYCSRLEQNLFYYALLLLLSRPGATGDILVPCPPNHCLCPPSKNKLLYQQKRTRKILPETGHHKRFSLKLQDRSSERDQAA